MRSFVITPQSCDLLGLEATRQRSGKICTAEGTRLRDTSVRHRELRGARRGKNWEAKGRINSAHQTLYWPDTNTQRPRVERTNTAIKESNQTMRRRGQRNIIRPECSQRNTIATSTFISFISNGRVTRLVEIVHLIFKVCNCFLVIYNPFFCG